MQAHVHLHSDQRLKFSFLFRGYIKYDNLYILINMLRDKIARGKPTHSLDKESINQLIRDYGSPLLVFDESIIKTRYKEIKGALDILYPKNKIAYSVKTNYLPALISILKDAGALSEVVSGFEYWLGKKFGDRHYEDIAERLSDCAMAIEKKWGDFVQYLDFGGGFLVPGARSRRRIIWDVPEINEYIKRITNVLNKKFTNGKPCLIVEPGRYLVDEAGTFITTVLNTKFAESFQDKNKIHNLLANILLKTKKNSLTIQIVTIDSSKTSILKSLSDGKHIKLLPKKDNLENKNYPTYIVGNSCIPSDYLTREIELPRLNKGDKILFSNAGAYSISRSEQFIHQRPAVILIKENGEIKRIRQKETYEDMISLCQP